MNRIHVTRETPAVQGTEGHRGGGFIAPRQARSQATADRILAATLELLAERPLQQISVQEITARAGVSVGGFYTRFRSKEAILQWLDESLLQPELEAALARLEDPAASGDLSTLVARYLETSREVFVRRRDLLRQVVLLSRSPGGEALRTQIRRFNERIDGRVVELLLAHRDEIRHPHPERAVAIGLGAVSAALREAALFGDYALDDPATRGEDLVRELAAMLLAYLGAARRGVAP